VIVTRAQHRQKPASTPATTVRGKLAVCLTAAFASAGLAVGVARCGVSPAGAASPQSEAARFLEGYARPDGRVVRLDQGHDTVSEGQAYGMLLAETDGDYAGFSRIWEWTRDHLQRRDGLFAFHTNAAGQLISEQPASDADVLIAWALLRYRGPDAARVHGAGRRVADSVLAHEVTTGPGGMPVLTAGPWAIGQPVILDPSYWAIPALQDLAQLTGREEWHRLAVGAVSITRELTQNGRLLPPDWAELSLGGTVQPIPAPDGSQPQPQYGPDAQRTVVWFASSCDPQAKALAARWWPLLRSRRHAQALSLSLSGTVLSATPAPLALVASAAAATAADHSAASLRLLSQAAAQQRSWPTYYGGAWAALGPALLTSQILGACSS
jgi:endoglucanase